MTNIGITGMILTAATTTVSSGDIDNPRCSGAAFIVDITAITGTTPSVTISIEGRDPASGKYYNILTSAAITTVSTTVLRIHPGLTTVANQTANLSIPRTIRITATIAGTTPSVTGTVGVNFNL